MSELEAKKRALVAESEIYRETLKLELHNLKLFGLRTKRKFSSFANPSPLLMLAAPLMGRFLQKRGSSMVRRLLISFLSYQVFNRLAPYLGGLLDRRMPSRPPAERSRTMMNE